MYVCVCVCVCVCVYADGDETGLAFAGGHRGVGARGDLGQNSQGGWRTPEHLKNNLGPLQPVYTASARAYIHARAHARKHTHTLTYTHTRARARTHTHTKV